MARHTNNVRKHEANIQQHGLFEKAAEPLPRIAGKGSDGTCMSDASGNPASGPRQLCSITLEEDELIRRYCENPTPEDWDHASSVIIDYFAGRVFTLWMVISYLDPSFQVSKMPGEPWQRIPTPYMIRKSLYFAGHNLPGGNNKTSTCPPAHGDRG